MTVQSMTGFARAQGVADGIHLAFELRSVNGRGLDLRFRLPAPLDALEPELRARAQRRLSRGNVQIGCSVKRGEDAQGPRINEAVFLQFAAVAERLAWSAKLADATVGDILRIPGVVEMQAGAEIELSDALRSAALATFETALDELVKMRGAEGASLATVIGQALDEIAAHTAAAAVADGARASAIQSRLKAQVLQLTESSSFDVDRLHQEAVLLATRMDVREEIDRLNAHVEQARALIGSGQPVGRRLDFLAQEFVREANTLCAKANDIALTRIGLDLKTVVEQFREQVQNIE